MNKVAIQGIRGSYHHQVAIDYFVEKVELSEFMSFDEVAYSIANENCRSRSACKSGNGTNERRFAFKR